MNYAQKLEQFNSTPKYKMEYNFLMGLFPNWKANILDYGCGLGAMVQRINAYTNHAAHGFDVQKYNPEFAYLEQFDIKYDVIYFMHSLAHINYAELLLKKLRKQLRHNGKVIVITPNQEWIDLNKNDFYKPDPTVIQHFTQTRLIELFEGCGYNVEIFGQLGQLTGSQNERLFLVAK